MCSDAHDGATPFKSWSFVALWVYWFERLCPLVLLFCSTVVSPAKYLKHWKISRKIIVVSATCVLIWCCLYQWLRQNTLSNIYM